MNYIVKKFVLGTALAVWGSCALAATTWTLDNKSSTAPTETGWKAGNNSSAIYSTSTGYWAGSGVGVGGESSVDGQHSLDNKSGYEMLMLNFGTESVHLDSVSLGWTQTDSDIFVLAYTGATPFTGSLAGATYASLLSNGWSLVGNYANVGSNTVQLNAAASLYSSFWLIGAGGFDGTLGVTSGDKSNGSWQSFTSSRYDYVKVAAVSGTVKQPPPPATHVPEPGSLALAGAAFLGILGIRRKRD